MGAYCQLVPGTGRHAGASSIGATQTPCVPISVRCTDVPRPGAPDTVTRVNDPTTERPTGGRNQRGKYHAHHRP